MAKIKGAIVVDTERCKGCNLCVVACPLHVIALTKEVNVKGYNYAHQILEDTCNGCASCAQVCPDGCISVFKVKVELICKSVEYVRRSCINERKRSHRPRRYPLRC